MPLVRLSGLLPLVLLLAIGCRREEVTVYRVEKETGAPSQAASPHGGNPHAPSPVMPRLAWKLPPGWTEQSATSMRVASFSVSGSDNQTADVAVIPLPGVTGRDLDMVNMWRNQVGLEAITAAEMERLVTSTAISGVEGKLFDMAGQTVPEGAKSPLRVVAALLDRDGTAWFFKMTGPDSLVGAQKSAFQEFLKSIEFRAGGMPDGMAVASQGAVVPGAAASAAPSDGRPHWNVPAGWQEVPAGQFLVAKFTLAGEGAAQAAVNISMSQGEGGGWASNVNRWRKQLGLSDQSEAEIMKETASLDSDGGKVLLVELAGTDAKSGQAARLIGAMVSQSDRSWFYKLMGDGKIVAAQKAAFTQFVQSAKY